FADSRASSLPIIASKFIYVHADEFIGGLGANVERVGKRMTHRLISMRQAVIDAFTNNFADIVPDCWRDIFAHHIAAKRERPSSLVFPPLSERHNSLKTGLAVCDLPRV